MHLKIEIKPVVDCYNLYLEGELILVAPIDPSKYSYDFYINSEKVISSIQNVAAYKKAKPKDLDIVPIISGHKKTITAQRKKLLILL